MSDPSQDKFVVSPGITGMDIPIIKLSVDHMRHAILMALDQDRLSAQLQEAAKRALLSIDFEKMVRTTVIDLAHEMLDDHSFMEPVHDWLEKNLMTGVESIIPPEEKETQNDDNSTTETQSKEPSGQQ